MAKRGKAVQYVWHNEERNRIGTVCRSIRHDSSTASMDGETNGIFEIFVGIGESKKNIARSNIIGIASTTFGFDVALKRLLDFFADASERFFE
jgi:hypothetical protein